MLSIQPASMQSNLELVAPLTSITYNLKNCKENIDKDSTYMYHQHFLKPENENSGFFLSYFFFVDLHGFNLLLELYMENSTMNNLVTILFQSQKN